MVVSVSLRYRETSFFYINMDIDNCEKLCKNQGENSEFVSDIMKKSLTKLILRKSEKIYQKQKKTGNFKIRVI